MIFGCLHIYSDSTFVYAEGGRNELEANIIELSKLYHGMQHPHSNDAVVMGIPVDV